MRHNGFGLAGLQASLPATVVDASDLLLPWAWLMFRILAHQPEIGRRGNDRGVWGPKARGDLGIARDFDNNEKIQVIGYYDGGQTVHYARPDFPHAVCEFSNIRPAGRVVEKEEIVAAGQPRKIAATARVSDTYHRAGSDGAEVEGELVFESSSFRSRASAFEHGYKQSLEQMIHYGTENVHGETKIGFEADQRLSESEESGDADRNERTVRWKTDVEPGRELGVRAIRTLTPSKAVLTGNGPLEFACAFGLRKNGNWQSHNPYNAAKARRDHYRRHVAWASKAEITRLFQGKGERSLDLWEAFRRHPVESWLLHPWMSEPDNRYMVEVEFDDKAIDDEIEFYTL